MDEETATGPPSDLPPSVTDYASMVLGAIEADMRHVHVRATVSAAVAAIFITQIDLTALRALEERYEVVLAAAILLLAVAAISYFHYTQCLNKTRLEIVQNLPNALRTREGLSAIASPWASKFMASPPLLSLSRPLLYYRLGQGCFLAGAILTGVVLAKILIL